MVIARLMIPLAGSVKHWEWIRSLTIRGGKEAGLETIPLSILVRVSDASTSYGVIPCSSVSVSTATTSFFFSGAGWACSFYIGTYKAMTEIWNYEDLWELKLIGNSAI